MLDNSVSEMGLWNLLKNANNPEGIREAMRMSFDKCLKLAVKSGLRRSSNIARHLALFETLKSRYQVSGIPTENAEVLIWAEILPFMWLDGHTSREALAEYVVYKEMPAGAKISWLTGIVQQGCKLGENETRYKELFPIAKNGGAVWLLLFESRGNDYFW